LLVFGFFRMLFNGGIVAARGGSPLLVMASSRGCDDPSLNWRWIRIDDTGCDGIEEEEDNNNEEMEEVKEDDPF
jgi:hypothetical protein